MKVEQLDFSKRPPGYAEYRPHGERGDHTACLTDEEAWIEYRRQHDPPSLSVARAYGHLIPTMARTDAWAWYETRLALAHHIARTVALNVWPRCLTWSDAEVTEVEDWTKWNATTGQKVARRLRYRRCSVADRIIFEETDAFMVGSVAYPVPRSLAIRLRRREGETTSWRPELEEALGWVWENRAPNLPVERYTRVHMLGRQTHVGEVTDLGGGALLVQAKRFEPTPEPRIIHYAYRSEAAGRYGVEYISDEQWAEYCKSLEFAAQQKQLAEKAKARAPLDPRADPPPGYTINFGPTDDDPDGEDHWTWISEDESSGLFQIRAEAVEDAWLHFVPSEEAPAANSVERLDFSKRPPGYSDRPHCERSGCDANMMDAEAWAHYKAQHDPPSISVVWEPDERWDEKSDGEWHVVTTVTGPTTILWHRTCGFVEKELRKPDVRTLAWASYERSLALAVKLEATTEDSHPLTSYCPPPWPCCLTWTDREVAAVERWLTDRTAEMPEVLRGR